MQPRRLRIAMISHYLPSGSKIGVGYWVDQFARELARRGHAVTIFSVCPPVKDAPYEVHTVEMHGSLRTFRFANHVRKLDLSRFDVLHAHGDDYLCWHHRVPAHVRTMHGSCFAEALHINGLWERSRMIALGVSELLATCVADRTFVVSPATQGVMPWVHDILPPGIDTARFARPADMAREPNPTILFVGTYLNRKRGSVLVDAFRKVVQPAIPNARLWMVCEDCPEFPGVVRLGRLDADELVQRYHRAWAFCLPSSYEGFGIPYAEALAAGLPVVATPNSGARYVLDQGRSGLLGQPDEIGTLLVDLLTDPQERHRLQRLGEQRAQYFDLRRVVDKYEEAYYELIGSST